MWLLLFEIWLWCWRYRVAKKFYSRLWGSAHGVGVDSSIVCQALSTSWSSPKEAFLSSSLGCCILISLDRHQGIKILTKQYCQRYIDRWNFQPSYLWFGVKLKKQQLKRKWIKQVERPSKFIWNAKLPKSFYSKKKLDYFEIIEFL